MQDEGVIKYVHKTDAEMKGGVRQMLTYLSKGGGGVWTPLFLADIICEQPLRYFSPNIHNSMNNYTGSCRLL